MMIMKDNSFTSVAFCILAGAILLVQTVHLIKNAKDYWGLDNSFNLEKNSYKIFITTFLVGRLVGTAILVHLA